MTRKNRAGIACKVFLALAVLGLVFPTLATTQEKAAAGKKPAGKPELVTTKAAQGPHEGQDPNVKGNSPKSNPRATASMGEGSKTRGSGPSPCSVRAENRTGWYIRVYMDGDYQTTALPNGALTGITGNGPTTLYGVAYFDDGSTKTWGPRVFNCPAYGSYTWQMLP